MDRDVALVPYDHPCTTALVPAALHVGPPLRQYAAIKGWGCRIPLEGVTHEEVGY